MIIERKDPHIYFIKASYTPFTDMKRISFDMNPHNGVMGVYTNDSKKKEEHSVAFYEPPTTLKFVVCHVPHTDDRYQTIQVSLVKCH